MLLLDLHTDFSRGRSGGLVFHVFQNFPLFVVIHTVNGFGIVNKTEVDVFLELSCFFNDPMDVGNLISGSSAFSKTSLNRTCLLRNLYAGQEATVRTGHETTDWFQIGKAVRQGCILSPCLFNLYAEYIIRNAPLEEAQLESRLPGEISITLDMQVTPPLWQKVKRN